MANSIFDNWISKGFIYVNEANPVEAAKCFQEAEKLNANLPVHVVGNWGLQLLKLQDIEKAEQLFGKLLNENPDSHFGPLGMGLISNKRKNWKEAVYFWEKAFHEFPSKVSAFWHIHLAEALINSGEFIKAKKYYAECIDSFPGNENGYTKMALLAQQMEDWQGAYDYWETCFAKFPERVKPWWKNQKMFVAEKLGLYKELQQHKLLKYKNEQSILYVNRLKQVLKVPGVNNLNFQHIFIITYGRTGSTLLQGILNTIDGVLVKGENGNIFYDFFNVYKKLIGFKSEHKKQILPTQPWYGIAFFNEDTVLEHFREVAYEILLPEKSLNPDTLCIGFKEVKYYEVGDDEFDAYLDFLARLFPNPAFIFLTRNGKDVSNSAWWRNRDKTEVLEIVKKMDQCFRNYLDKNADFCFLIDYQDMVGSRQKMKDLFNFLGATFNPEMIESALLTPHSYSPEMEHVKELVRLGKNELSKQ